MQKIDRLDSFSSWLERASDDTPPIAVQDLDLRGLGRDLMTRPWSGCLFLGCDLELEQAGVVFHSDTDTEVLLKSYQQWGRGGGFGRGASGTATRDEAETWGSDSAGPLPSAAGSW